MYHSTFFSMNLEYNMVSTMFLYAGDGLN